MKRIVVFDLETKRLAHEVGGWNHIDKMGFAVGVTYDVSSGSFNRFTEDQTDQLLDLLIQAQQIIGFNLIRFDYTVLRPYGFQITDAIRVKTVDLLQDIYNSHGFRIGLDNLVGATLDKAKSADGLAAVKWFREGKIDKIFDYCEQDVLVTYQLWVYGAKHGHVIYSDRQGNTREVQVKWTVPPIS